MGERVSFEFEWAILHVIVLVETSKIEAPMHRNDQQLRLGTRGSPLALWQARWVAERVEATGSCEVALEIVKTTAEQFPEKALTQLGVEPMAETEAYRQAIVQGDPLPAATSKATAALKPGTENR